MKKNILITSIIYLILTLNAFSAGSGGNDGGGEESKSKTNYEKAVAHIKFAKKYEKKQRKDMKRHKSF